MKRSCTDDSFRYHRAPCGDATGLQCAMQLPTSKKYLLALYGIPFLIVNSLSYCVYIHNTYALLYVDVCSTLVLLCLTCLIAQCRWSSNPGGVRSAPTACKQEHGGCTRCSSADLWVEQCTPGLGAQFRAGGGECVGTCEARNNAVCYGQT